MRALKTLALALFLIPAFAAGAQTGGADLPRLAVVEFTSASPDEATTVREIVESVMINSGNYTMVNTFDIDKILAQQKIAVSSIASQENITKLQRLNIKYIVTGSVRMQGSEAMVALRMLDVSNAVYVPSSPSGVVSMASMSALHKGVSDIAAKFLSGMASSGAEVVRSGGGGSGGRPGAAPAGMVRIDGGSFLMGSPSSEADRYGDEGPQHQVTVSGFYMGQYEVTQAEYQAVMGTNPSNFKGDNLPVEMVTWYDAVRYCNQRSTNERLTPAYNISGSAENPFVTWNKNANGYRLPTEAEWEYACRAGTTTPFSTGYNITTSQANYNGNYPYNGNSKGTYREKTTAVGSFAPNGYGLYDMHGNVWEWCWDWYDSNYYSSGAQTDPSGAASGSRRVNRGGSWSYGAKNLRSAHRDSFAPSIWDRLLGFRVVRP